MKRCAISKNTVLSIRNERHDLMISHQMKNRILWSPFTTYYYILYMNVYICANSPSMNSNRMSKCLKKRAIIIDLMQIHQIRYNKWIHTGVVRRETLSRLCIRGSKIALFNQILAIFPSFLYNFVIKKEIERKKSLKRIILKSFD